MNPTLDRFGYPATLLRAYDHWAVVMRPAQVTVGSLVLATKGTEEHFADMSAAAFLELKTVVEDVEANLRRAFGFDKINYLMLMMSDPQVHFHVIPRRAEPVDVGGTPFGDAGWPGPPDIARPLAIDDDQRAEILHRLRWAWGQGG
jgi:diadenosine tetraphosphate (Ap4A) HIT family hydrolase